MRKVAFLEIKWDPEIMDHLTYALSDADHVEQVLPIISNRAERWYSLALSLLWCCMTKWNSFEPLKEGFRLFPGIAQTPCSFFFCWAQNCVPKNQTMSQGPWVGLQQFNFDTFCLKNTILVCKLEQETLMFHLRANSGMFLQISVEMQIWLNYFFFNLVILSTNTRDPIK